MSMSIGRGPIAAGFTEFAPEGVVPSGSRVIEVEFRNLEADVSKYIKIDINSQTLTKSDFQKLIIQNTGWPYRPEDLNIFCGCGGWEKPLLKDNPAFVKFVSEKQLFHVLVRPLNV